MYPNPGRRLVRHVGDAQHFSIRGPTGCSPDTGWQARVRTNLGRGRMLREEVIHAHTRHVPAFGASWHDVPLPWTGDRWARDLVLAEPGFHAAKAYLIDARGFQLWPSGPDVGLSVHPDWCRSANTLYCAFTRLFGATRTAPRHLPEPDEPTLKSLERQGYAVLPPSGTLRDLTRQLPHILGRLGCRILHLLPIHPTPTVFARFGRQGSPYAALDLTAIDPALVEFDARTTGVEQFTELTRATHRLGGRVFLDIVINHTGWGSRLQEEHPEFFRREPDGRFACPGAWGVVWEDLVELEQHRVELWDLIAESLLTWCRRGVDGFRCDAGYKIPTHVWQYITARVTGEFPDTVFLLEGLGGSWEATETLLGPGGMHWAYSELFQNHSGSEVQSYLDYALPQSANVGTYVHYSETHDNDRLAARGQAWSRLRNRLCALTSASGGFGFTAGVEWLAEEKILVHQRTGLAWGQEPNLVDELAHLNRLLADHPAFFDGAALHRVSPPGSTVFALERVSQDGCWQVLVLANTNPSSPASLAIPAHHTASSVAWSCELLGDPFPTLERSAQAVTFHLPPGAVLCLAPRPGPESGSGTAYRHRHARIAWALRMAAHLVPSETLLNTAPHALATHVANSPARWLAALAAERDSRSPHHPAPSLDLAQLAARAQDRLPFPCVMRWRPSDARRVVAVPAGWWLLVEDDVGFRAHLRAPDAADARAEHEESIPTREAHVVAFPPRRPDGEADALLVLERHCPTTPSASGRIRFLSAHPSVPTRFDPDGLVVLANARGGMACLRVDLGAIQSKYDCALAANLHPAVPVDRHVFAKRVRAWLNADGFISALDRHNLEFFEPGPPAIWEFRVNAGNARHVRVRLEVGMPPGHNSVIWRFSRAPDDAPLPASLTLRVDLEDRGYHSETHRNPDAERHFEASCQTLDTGIGFEFNPHPTRSLRAELDRGRFHRHPEWSVRVPHPIEASRGHVAHGDAYSPGWFEIPLAPGESATLVLDAESTLLDGPFANAALNDLAERHPTPAPGDLEAHFSRALEAFVVRRDEGHSVIAGYPWFLDWGRDTLIVARGLLAGGWNDHVREILRVFGRFADRGTLPNSIHGNDASNRDTSDAPLWYIVVLEEALESAGPGLLSEPLHPAGPTLHEVAPALGAGYRAGPPNGLRVDPESALVWSPSHFTWMDTNHPAGTPREGYPVEIQALWLRALRFLARHDPTGSPRAASLFQTARHAFARLFWLPQQEWYSDVLLGPSGTPASQAEADTALRCNALIPVALGIAEPHQARAQVAASLQHLLVPGAVRSLAPLPVSPPLPIHGPDGRLLNDPHHPYWGRYEGNEDTHRKPAYHNGTAWTWFLPILAEALAVAWAFEPASLHAARSLLGSLAPLLASGSHGQIPEVLDGDAPHRERGCHSQAWAASEALRVWRRLLAQHA